MRILLVQPQLNPPGGGNAVAAWMVQALRRDHELTVLTRRPVRLGEINDQFGTALSTADAHWLCMPESARGWSAHLPIRGELLAGHCLDRYARTIRGAYDLALTAANESDIGAPAIQYVHYPKLDPDRPVEYGRRHHRALTVAAYQQLAAWLTGFSASRARANLTMANSAWTAQKLRSACGIEAIVVPPPIALAVGRATFEEREDCFVAVGRFARDKRIEVIVEIVERLRARGWQSRLRIIGNTDDRAYAGSLAALAASRSWMEVSTDTSRSELTTVLHTARWGVHAMVDEHYGMAVAEMVRAGCLVFAHDSGGPAEILPDRRLRYRDVDEAVARIEAASKDAGLRAQLQAVLGRSARALDVETFSATLRSLVTTAVAGRGV